MEDVATPSINAQLMPQFIGKRVRVVCELNGAPSGSALQAQTSDGGSITILQDPRAGIPSTKYVEFIGTVADATTLREESNTQWGNTFDLAMHNSAVNLMNGKYAYMFNQL